jgi:hypothetical protein
MENNLFEFLCNKYPDKERIIRKAINLYGLETVEEIQQNLKTIQEKQIEDKKNSIKEILRHNGYYSFTNNDIEELIKKNPHASIDRLVQAFSFSKIHNGNGRLSSTSSRYNIPPSSSSSIPTSSSFNRQTSSSPNRQTLPRSNRQIQNNDKFNITLYFVNMKDDRKLYPTYQTTLQNSKQTYSDKLKEEDFIVNEKKEITLERYELKTLSLIDLLERLGCSITKEKEDSSNYLVNTKTSLVLLTPCLYNDLTQPEKYKVFSLWTDNVNISNSYSFFQEKDTTEDRINLGENLYTWIGQNKSSMDTVNVDIYIFFYDLNYENATQQQKKIHARFPHGVINTEQYLHNMKNVFIKLYNLPNIMA